ncbi:MAG: HdeD family acid-resistance protein [Acidimicrobiales bacterium]
MPGAKTASGWRGDPIGMVGRSWAWVLFFGVTSVLVGILVAAQPVSTVFGFAVLVAIWLFVSGVFRLVSALADTAEDATTRVLNALLGVLSVFIGLIFARNTFETLATLGFLIGAFWVVGGIVEAFAGYRHSMRGARAYHVLMGVLSIFAGIVTLAYPGLTLLFLAVFIGIWLIFYGVGQIALAMRMRELGR